MLRFGPEQLTIALPSRVCAKIFLSKLGSSAL